MKTVRGECFPFVLSMSTASLDTATPTRDERVSLCEANGKCIEPFSRFFQY